MSSTTRGTVLGIGVVVLIGVASVPLCDYALVHVFDGVFEGALVDGDALVVGEVTSMSSGGEGSIVQRRLVRLSLADGHEIVRRGIDGGESRCALRGARLFCVTDRLRAFDALTLEDVSSEWYGEGKPLGEALDDPPGACVSGDRVVTRARSGRFVAIAEDGAAEEIAEPQGCEPLRWPSGDLERRAMVAGGPIENAELLAPELLGGWLVARRASLDSADGTYLGVLRATRYAEVTALLGESHVSGVFRVENDAIVIARVGDHTEVLRLTPVGDLVFRVSL